jgi:hypothetical protein
VAVPGALERFAARRGVTVVSRVSDGSGWRWRATYRGVGLGAWNDMDGVAVVADIGPADAWVGLRGHPPDPSEREALEWAVTTIEAWLADPEHAVRIGLR